MWRRVCILLKYELYETLVKTVRNVKTIIKQKHPLPLHFHLKSLSFSYFVFLTNKIYGEHHAFGYNFVNISSEIFLCSGNFPETIACTIGIYDMCAGNSVGLYFKEPSTENWEYFNGIFIVYFINMWTRRTRWTLTFNN